MKKYFPVPDESPNNDTKSIKRYSLKKQISEYSKKSEKSYRRNTRQMAKNQQSSRSISPRGPRRYKTEGLKRTQKLVRSDESKLVSLQYSGSSTSTEQNVDDANAQLSVQAALQEAALLARMRKNDEALESYRVLKLQLEPHLGSLWAIEYDADVSFIMGKIYEQDGDMIIAAKYYKEAYSSYCEARSSSADCLPDQTFQVDLKTVLVLEVMGRLAFKKREFRLANELYGTATSFLEARKLNSSDPEKKAKWELMQRRLDADCEQVLMHRIASEEMDDGELTQCLNDDYSSRNVSKTLSLSASTSMDRGSRGSSLGDSTCATEDLSMRSRFTDQDHRLSNKRSQLADLDFMNVYLATMMTGVVALCTTLTTVVDNSMHSLSDKLAEIMPSKTEESKTDIEQEIQVQSMSLDETRAHSEERDQPDGTDEVMPSFELCESSEKMNEASISEENFKAGEKNNLKSATQEKALDNEIISNRTRTEPTLSSSNTGLSKADGTHARGSDEIISNRTRTEPTLSLSNTGLSKADGSLARGSEKNEEAESSPPEKQTRTRKARRHKLHDRS